VFERTFERTCVAEKIKKKERAVFAGIAMPHTTPRMTADVIAHYISQKLRVEIIERRGNNAEVTTRHTLKIRAFHNDENGDDGDAMRRANTKSNYKSSFRSSQ